MRTIMLLCSPAMNSFVRSVCRRIIVESTPTPAQGFSNCSARYIAEEIKTARIKKHECISDLSVFAHVAQCE